MGESDGRNNSSRSSSLTSFRLAAQPAESCDRYIVTRAAKGSGCTGPSNGFTLGWAGGTEANNGVFHLAAAGMKTSRGHISGLQMSLILTHPGEMTVDNTKKNLWGQKRHKSHGGLEVTTQSFSYLNSPCGLYFDSFKALSVPAQLCHDVLFTNLLPGGCQSAVKWCQHQESTFDVAQASSARGQSGLSIVGRSFPSALHMLAV